MRRTDDHTSTGHPHRREKNKQRRRGDEYFFVVILVCHGCGRAKVYGLLLGDCACGWGVARRIAEGDSVCSRDRERIGEERTSARDAVRIGPMIGGRITIYVECAAAGGK